PVAGTKFGSIDGSTQVVTITVTDPAGNTDDCTATLTLVDNIAPQITCPGNITQTASAGVCEAVVNFTATATDNCSAVVTYSHNPGTSFPVGTTTVTATATDPAGNTDVCTFTVTVTDDEAPNITCPTSYTATGNSACTGVVNVAPPVYDDNCGVTSFSWTMSGATNASGVTPIGTYTFNRGTTTILYTVTDAAGNEDQCSYQITIPNLLTVTASASAPVICEGDVLTLSAAPAGGTPNYLYAWTGPNGFTSNVQNPQISNITTAASGSYMLTVTDNNGCTVNASVSVIVRPTPKATISGTTAVCQNEAPAPVVTFTNNMADAVVVTYNINGGGATTLDIAGGSFKSVSHPTGTAGNYVYNLVEVRYATGVGCPNTAPSSATITVYPTPTVNPISDRVYCKGATVGSLMPTGPVNNTSFTWTNNNTSIGLAASGSGAVSAFTATNATDDPIDAVITIIPKANGCTGTPLSYTITVNPTPRAIISGTTTVCYGEAGPPVTFTNPMGLPIIIEYNINNLGTQTIVVAANSTATITAPTTTAGTFNYNLVSAAYQSSPDCRIGITGTATVTVDPKPIANATPQSQTICSGETIIPIALSSTTSGTTYSWTRNNTTSVTGIAANGTGDISGTLTNTTVSPVTVVFYITPQAAGCPGSQIEARVTVNPIPVATITDNNGSRCSGVNISEIVLSSSVGGTTFTWTRDNTDLVSGIPASGSGSAINGALTNLTSTPVPVTFTVTPKANGCVGADVTTTITINPIPQIEDTILTICNSGFFDATPIDGINGIVPAGTSYTWNIQSNTGGVTGAVDGNGTSITGTLGNSTNTLQTVTYAVYPRFGGCLGNVFLVKVNVTPEPDIVDMTAIVCSNENFTVKPVNITHGIVPSGTKYTWSAPILPAGLTGGAENTIPASTISATLTNTTNATLTAIYTVTPSNGTCLGEAFELTVTVNPAASINASNISTCSGAGFSFTPLHGVDGAVVPAGTTYSWSAPDVDAGITGGTAGSGASTISGTLFNSGSLPLKARYTVTPKSAGCNGVPFVLTVTVDPVPAIDPIPQTICSGQTFTITPADGTNGAIPGGTTYSWAIPVVTGGITGGQAGTNLSEISGTLTNPTNTPQTATYKVIPTSGACVGIEFQVIVTVNPTPVISTINTTVCNGVAFSIKPLNGVNGVVPSGTTYTWAAPVLPAGVSGGVENTTPSADINGTLTSSSSDAEVVTYVVSASSGTCNPSTFNVNVTVNPTPTASISGGGTVCDNAGTADIIFTNPMDLPVTVTYNIDGGTSFTVDIPANASETVPATISQAGTFVYNLVNVAYQSNPTCSTPISGQSTTLTVEPITTAGISADQTTICFGTEVTFTATVTNEGTNPIYKWYKNNVEIIGESALTYVTSDLVNSDKIRFEVTTTAGTPCLGTTASNTVTMTVNPSYTTSVTISENANNICEGETVTFSSTVVNGGLAPTYQWYLNGTTPVGTNSNTYTTNALVDGDIVTLFVTASDDLCTFNNGEATSAPVVMTVNDNVDVAVSIAANADPVCAGSSVTFTATPTNGGLSPVYQWYKNGSVVGTNSATYTYIPSDGDVVSVLLTASGEICTLDDEASATYTINVDPLPAANAGGSHAICENSSYTLTAGEATATNYATISWSENGAGNITAGANTLTPTYTASAADAGKTVTLTMTVTGSSTCGTKTAIATYSILVDPLPTATAGGSQTICVNGAATVSGASASNGTISWTENGAGTITSGATTLTPTYTPAPGDAGTSVTLTMTVTSNNTCGSTATAIYTVNVDPLPTAIAGGSATICSDEAYTLGGGEASATNGTILWTENGAGSITNGTTLTPTYTAVAGDAGKTVTLTMTVTSNNTCAPAKATANYTINVSPLPPAIPGIISGETDVCHDDTGLTYSIAAVPNATNYTWTVPAGWTIVSGQGTTSITVNATTSDGDISVVASNTCGTSTARILPVISVDDVPATPGEIIGASAICPTKTETYYIDPVSGATSYIWTVPTGWTNLTGQGTNTITVNVPSGASSGDVTVTAVNVCGNTPGIPYQVTVDNTATVYAGPDQIVCQGSGFVILSGDTDGAIDHKKEWDWVAIDGGTIVSPDDLNSRFNFPVGFTFGTLRVVIAANPSLVSCSSPNDTMTITVLAYPTAEAGGPDIVCQSATPSALALSGAGIGGGATTGAWSIVNGGGTLSSSAQTNNPAAVTYTPAANFSGTVTLRLTTNAPGGCTAATDTRTITINPLPTASAGGSQTICANETATVSGASASNGTILWTHDGTGTLANATTLTPTYTSGVGDAGNTVELTMTVSGTNSCSGETATASFTIVVDPLPEASAGGSQSICMNETATVSGTSANNGSILWTHNGSGSITNATTLTPTYTPAAGDAGKTVVLTMTVSSTNSCAGETATASYTVVVDPLPSASADGSQTICADETATVSGASASNGDVLWTHNGAGSLTNETTLTPSYTSVAGDAGNSVILTMTVSSTNNCAGATATASYTVNVDPLPTATAGGVTTICADNTYTLLPGEANAAYGTISWTEDGAGSITSGSTTLTPTYTPAAGDAGQTVTLTLTVTSNINCGVATDTYTIQVDPIATVTAGDDQTVCQGDPVVLTGSFGGGASSATWVGGTGTFSPDRNTPNATYTPSNTEINAGSVTLTLTTNDPAGPCGPVSDAVTIIIQKKVVITSQPANTGVCVGESADLTVAAVGDNLSYQWYKDNFPISGATAATLHFNAVTLADEGSFYVVVSGASECSPVQSATVTLNVDAAITISKQPASATKCAGENVIFTVTAGANGAALTYQWRKGGVDISGATSSSYSLSNLTPADGGVYDVVIKGTGGFSCGSITSSSATLTIGTDGTISNPASKDQTICEGDAIANIVFAIGGSATGATLTGALPAGLTQGYNNSTKEYTISGTPTETGTYSYTLTTTGSTCVNPSISGTLTINTHGTISLAGGNANPTLCINNPLPNITYSIGGSANGASITSGSLPPGVSGTYSNGLFTIKGTPAAAGTYPFTVTTSGSSCNNPSLSGTITVNPDATLSRDSGDPNQTVCINTPITSINYSSGGSAGSVVLTGQLPAGVEFTEAGGIYTISGTPSVAGTYNYTVTTTGPCQNVSESGSITVDNLADPGILSPAISTTCTDTLGANSGTLTLIDYSGSIVQWEASYDGGQTWDTIPHTGASYTYNNLPNTTLFSVLVQNGSCDPFYSAIARVTVIPSFKPIITSVGGNACAGEPVILYGTVDVVADTFSIIAGGLFNTANPKGWRIWQDGVILHPFPASGDNENATPWAETNGPKQFCGTDYDSGEKKFSIVMGEPGENMNSWMETPIFELLSTMSSAELNFDHAYDLAPGATAKVEISLDGGDTYNTTLASYTGTLNSGMPNVVNPIEIDLSPYIGMDNLRIRFNFDSNSECSVWAIDNITLPSPPADVTYVWGPVEEIPLGVTGSPVTVYPGTSTTYTLTMYVAGCPGSATEHLVWVYEYPEVQTVNACVGGGDVIFTMTNGTEGGTWTVSGGGTITSAGVFTPTTPGCYVATYETPSGGCTGSANFVVFPEAPTPTVNTGCGPIVVTPPPTVDGFNIEYSFDNGATWGANIPPTADNCSPGYYIKTRYVTANLCDPTPVGNISENSVCSESPAVIRSIDYTAPTFTVPANKSISKDANCNYNASVSVTGDVSDEADNCSTGLNASYTDVVLPGACEGEEIITRTWSLTDDCGNTTTGVQTITVLDNNEPPEFTVPADITIYKDADCNYDASVAHTGDVTDERDNCSTGLEATYSDATSTEDDCGAITITRTWTLADNCGNSVSKVQLITVLVNIPPVITCPADIVVECIDDVPAPDINVVSVTDICGQVTITHEGDVSDGNTCPEVITRTYKATDLCGLYSVTCTQKITIDDTTDPVISSLTDKTIEACDIATALASEGLLPYSPSGSTITLAQLQAEGGDASDNCSLASVSYIDVTLGSCPWTIRRTYSATDACGNVASSTQTFVITIDDTTPPVVTADDDQEIEACSVLAGLPSYSETAVPVKGMEATYGFSVTEDCTYEITYVDKTSGSCPWTVTRTFTATDGCDNTGTATQIFTIDDTTAPVITPGTAQNIEACSVLAGLPTYSETSVTITGDEATYGLSVDEDCTYEITYIDVTAGSCPWVVTRTFTATDDCGNVSTSTQIFTIDDTTAPVITPGTDQNIEACSVLAGLPTYRETSVTITGQGATYGFSVNEDCNYTITYVDVTTGSCPWVVTRTFTATDACGNVGTAKQTFTIDDTTAPVITPGTAQNIEACSVLAGLPTYRETSQTITGDEATYGFSVDEDCTYEITYVDATSGSCPWTVTRTFTATDACGNVGTATQIFTIDDTTAPVVTADDDQVIEACSVLAGLPSYSTTAVIVTGQEATFGFSVTEDCGYKVTYVDVTAGSCPWVVTRTFTATDDCGNEGTATQTFTIDDTVVPVISSPTNKTIEACDIATALASEGLLPYSPSGSTITLAQLQAEGGDASDNCSLASVSYIDVTTGSCPWTVSRTYSATDACGNVASSTQTFVITIDDTTPPVVTAGDDKEIEACSVLAGLPSYSETAVPVKGQEATYGFSVTEDCTYEITYVDKTAGSCPWIVTRTFTATDGCGNTGTATQIFTIDDTTDPVFSQEASNGIADCYSPDPATNADFLNWLADNGGARATDNCDTNLEWTNNSASQSWVRSGIDYTITVTFTVTDDCGNTNETTASFTVRDDVPPTIACPVSSNAEPDLFEETVSGDGCEWQPTNVPNPVIDDVCGLDRLVYTLSGATTGSSPATGFNYVSDADLNVGITTVTYTVYDIAGNSAECSIRIWIKNTVDPRFEVTCPDPTASTISVSAETDLCDAEVTVPAPVIDNLCVESFSVSYQIDGGTSVAVTPPAAVGTVVTLNALTERFEVGTHTVTWTIVDASGNVYTCNINITVTDDQLPTITCPPDVEDEITDGGCDLISDEIGEPT
ncbi:PKD-like domain-containing protein, partial [Maribellus sp. YY47]|uniref:PKD-like domain-containing protein n=1 Tax=Maribellus sp. YY47 TaxID=2929486 RepID=UPI00200089C3